MLGVLWPVKDFEKAVGRSIKTRELFEAVVSGGTFSGVLRSSEHGTPPGSKEIFKRTMSSCEKNTELASMEDAVQ